MKMNQQTLRQKEERVGPQQWPSEQWLHGATGSRQEVENVDSLQEEYLYDALDINQRIDKLKEFKLK